MSASFHAAKMSWRSAVSMFRLWWKQRRQFFARCYVIPEALSRHGEPRGRNLHPRSSRHRSLVLSSRYHIERWRWPRTTTVHGLQKRAASQSPTARSRQACSKPTGCCRVARGTFGLCRRHGTLPLSRPLIDIVTRSGGRRHPTPFRA